MTRKEYISFDRRMTLFFSKKSNQVIKELYSYKRTRLHIIHLINFKIKMTFQANNPNKYVKSLYKKIQRKANTKKTPSQSFNQTSTVQAAITIIAPLYQILPHQIIPLPIILWKEKPQFITTDLLQNKAYKSFDAKSNIAIQPKKDVNCSHQVFIVHHIQNNIWKI